MLIDRYNVAEPMVSLAEDLRVQGFELEAMGTSPATFGLMRITSPSGYTVGYYTDAAYRRRPLAMIRQIVRASMRYGFRIPNA